MNVGFVVSESRLPRNPMFSGALSSDRRARMAAVRFEVVVNGRVVGTAGLDGAGFLNVLLRASRTECESDPLDPAALPIIEESELVVGGHDLALGDMHWARLGL